MSKKDFKNFTQQKHKEFVQYATTSNYYRNHNIENPLNKEYE